MTLEEMKFDHEFGGIWACASIFHVARSNLSGVIDRFHRALKPKGVTHLSFKEGDADIVKDGRAFTNFTLASFNAWLRKLRHWALVETWLTEDIRLDQNNEFSVNGLIRKS